MKRRITWLIVSGLLIAALLLPACGPAVTEKEKAEEEKKEEVAVKEKATEQFVWLDQGGWVRPEFVDDVKEVAPDVYLVYPYTLEEPQYGGIINTFSAGDPANWDPWTTLAKGNLGWGHEQLLSGRITLPEEVNSFMWASYVVPQHLREPWLCESFEWLDPQTLIFHMRKGIKFNCGLKEIRALVGDREMVAADVVYSFSRWIGLYGMPLSASEISVAQYIDEVVALDKYTVRLHTSRYHSELIYNICCMNSTQIYPREVVDKYGDYNNWRNYCGTGAFITTDVVPASSVIYTANKEYWGTSQWYGEDYPVPFVDGVKALIIPDRSTQVAALRAGKIDYLDATLEDVKSIVKSNPELMWRKTMVSQRIFSLRKDKWPWSELKFRQALWMAINHQELIKSLYGGDGGTAGWPVNEAGGSPPFIATQDLPKEPTVKAVREPVVTTKDGRVVHGNELIVQEDSTVSAYELYNWSPENLVKARALLDEVLGPGVHYAPEICASIASVYTYNEAILAIVEYWKEIGIDAEFGFYEGGVASTLRYLHTYKDISPGGGLPAALRCMSWEYWGGKEPLDAYNNSETRDAYYDQMLNDIVNVVHTTAEVNQMTSNLFVYHLEAVLKPSYPTPYDYKFWQPWLKGGYKGQVGLCYADSGNLFKEIWIDRELKDFIKKKY